MKSSRRVLFVVALTALLSSFILHPSSFGQGALTPPGPPGPTFKTLQQVEPRTPITNLPYTISQPGSYYLVSNLTASSIITGIVVQADSVVIDLGGFALTGSGVVDLVPRGVYVPSPRRQLTVRNGTIRNWGHAGLDAEQASNCLVENVQASGQINYGIVVGPGSTISHSLASSNASAGIRAGRGSTISHCAAEGNSNGTGIVVDEGGLIVHCAASGNNVGLIAGPGGLVQSSVSQSNTFRGVLLGRGASVLDCTVVANVGDGILALDGEALVTRNHVRNNRGSDAFSGYGIYAVGTGNHIAGNLVASNSLAGINAGPATTIDGCTVVANGGDGIVTGLGSTVKGNTVRGSTGDGIEVLSDCRVADNHCTENVGAGIRVTGAGNRLEANSLILNAQGVLMPPGANLVIRNSARFNPGSGSIGSSNFVGTAGNDVGPIGTAAASTSPWANISY